MSNVLQISCKLVVSFWVILISAVHARKLLDNSALDFPEEIISFGVRKDILTEEKVTRGRLSLINYRASSWIPPNNELQKTKMVTFKDLQRNLQCANIEVDLDGVSGGWSLFTLAPPTKESLESICAFAETKCEPWSKCREIADRFKIEGDFERSLDDLSRVWGTNRGGKLLRVIDNEVYYDWPWGIDRFQGQESHYSNLLTDHFSLLEMVLRIVSDIGDSVFFFGGENTFMPWDVPFPTFSFAPTFGYADMPFPWLESYNSEHNLYAEAEAHNNFTDEFFKSLITPWHDRVPKAAFFASMDKVRRLAYDSAALRPDLFDVAFAYNNKFQAWNPQSDEPLEEHDVEAGSDPRRNHTGFIQPILQFRGGRNYVPHHYKYVIVMLGSGGLSTSGRLAHILAHSGAVVLLQNGGFSYHFSARLVPWVHYVPITFTGADLIAKVQWLRDHDDMALQIVQNAANFGRSFLRMEDYLCYAASALKMISDVEATTNVTQGFSPRLIHRIIR
jgi:hypothetical protein